MGKMLLACLMLLLVFAALSPAQIVVGPEDDPTVIDTTIPPGPIPRATELIYPLYNLSSSQTVNSTNISQLDCSQFPLICLYLDILDANGDPIGGMTGDSICLSQDGFTVDSFSIQQLSLDSCITSVCLVVDVSGSMSDGGRLTAAKNAMHRFVDNMDPFDRVAIVPYSSCIGTITPFTSNKTTLHNAINALSANGYTACFDGIYKGVDLTKLELGSKAVIAFTDGLENRSQLCYPPPDGVNDNTYADDSTLICNLANSSGVPIYTFNLGSITNTWYNPEALQAFANGTGGYWDQAPNNDDIDSLYTRIKQRLCSRYYICYYSSDTIQNGDTHTVVACYYNGGACSPCDTAFCQERDNPHISRTPITVGLEDTCQSDNSPLTICAYITDKDTPPSGLTVTLFYRVTGQVSYTSAAMTAPPGDSTFCATIPASVFDCKVNFDYYITASDGQVTVSSPSINPQVSPFSIDICPSNPPVANAGSDQTVFQCAAAPLCWPASCSDPDNNLKTCELISGTGTFNGSQICFTPSGTMNYEFVLKATDSCGATDYDTVVIYYTLNVPPTANAGRDSTLFQCAPAPICWPASCADANGNLSSCLLVSGPGSYNGSSICFTPSASGSYSFILEATDACGAKKRDTAIITVTLNQPPVCSIPNDTSVFQCAAGQLCLPVSATDPNGNFKRCQIISGPGSLSGGNWCYTPTGDQTVNVTIRCEDSCGAYCEDSFSVQFEVNQAPVIAFGNDSSLFQCTPATVCVTYALTDDEGNVNLEELLSGPGSIDTALNKVCFTPATAGIYSIVVKATDACGAVDFDTINVTVGINQPPVANAGSDQTLFQCAPTQVCWPASCSDPDGNLSTCILVSGVGSYNGTNICFTPTVSGSYTFILEATDACGLTDRDTAIITVTINSAPVCVMPPDTSSFFQCAPATVSLPVGATDVDNNFSLCQILSGPGSLVGGNWVYTPSGDEFRKVVVQCLDACGAACIDSFFVKFDINAAPIANAGSDQTLFQCAPAQVCWSAGATDPDNNISSVQLVSGIGTFDGTQICFTPSASGSYTFILQATDACGATDRDTSVINVTLNSPPVANAGVDQSLFQCVPTSICLPASCSDIDGNLTGCALISGTGTYSGGNICFTPAGSGSYTFIIEASDACGATDRDTVTVNVSLNGSPSIAFGNDTSLFLCQPQPICLGYTVSDPQGLNKLVETMVSGFGYIDTLLNQVCFTPTGSGVYQFIVRVSDSCGAADQDTVVANISFGQFAVIDCPTAPLSVSLCGPETVCQTIDITPASATVSVSYGTYSGGELCFMADTSGTYLITIIASSSCGADTCQLTFNVDIGQAAQLSCPAPMSKFICLPGQVCAPVGVIGDGATVTVSPIGSYNSGNVCFPADTNGHYVLTVIASTACGADTCQIVMDITINARPMAVDPPSPVDTFLCAAAAVCRQFSATDINGGPLTWSKISGNGTISGAGLWCFNPATSGAYSVTAAVTDSCGGADTVSLTYNINLNDPPDVSLGDDMNQFACAGSTLCFQYSLSDDDNNIVQEELLAGPGTIDTAQNRVCFVPPATGTYTFIVRVTDFCGLSDVDTINVTALVNVPPVANAGADQTLLLCSAVEICWAASCSDVNGNLTSCALISGPGTYGGGNICFTPAASGSYMFIMEATDACGATDRDTAIINITLNQTPLCSAPDNQNIFQCTPSQICLPVSGSDPDGNFDRCEIYSGPGTLAGGNWCFTPTSDQTVNVTIRCLDSCGAYCEDNFTITVDINQPPVLAFGNDTSPFICGSSAICLGYAVSDPENNVTLEELLPGAHGGTIDTALNRICFTPTVGGTYTFIGKVTDACGATDLDTINVSVSFNTPPVANAGADQNVFQCSPAPVCWPASCSDVNGNLTGCALVSGQGAYSGGNICFTPTVSGIYTFIIEATDACAATDRDTVMITVTLNSPPVCNLPPDTNKFFQCSPSLVSLPVSGSDPDGNFDHCEIVSGPGSLSGGNWTYTPSGDEFRKVVIRCLDACGLSCIDSFFVQFDVNFAPVANAGADQNLFQCVPAEICWNAGASDPDNNITSVALVSGTGTFNGSQICFTPSNSGTYTFILEATDACGFKDRDTAMVTVNFNRAPVVIGPPDYTLFFDYTDQFCFDITVSDQDNNLSSVVVSPVGTYNSTTGRICVDIDSIGTYCLTITATDVCGAIDVDTVCIEIQLDECIHVQIEKVHNVLQGHHKLVNIILNGSGKALGGFDFLIAYDNSALNPGVVLPGALLTECAWEYFTYRFGYSGQCTGCPSGLLRVVALAETNNGAYHPDCYLNGRVGAMASIDFLVSNDRNLECQFVPIRFFWLDCGDNSIASPSGDTLWISRDVFDFQMNNITDYNDRFPTFLGAPDSCLVGGGPDKPAPIRCIDFINGGVDIICADSIDARGDVNLNGVPHEIGDAVVFTNYFIYGLGAFTVNLEGQIAATEINGDGITLSVADLVYLVRVIVGDAQPLAKPGPEAFARFHTEAKVVKAQTNTSIGALLMIFDGEARPTLGPAASGMEMKFIYRDGITRVLIYSFERGKAIGSGDILSYDGAAELVAIDAADYHGSVLKANAENFIPTEYALDQNYPNPFNPKTIIEFALPNAGEWTLEIFNILGQKVETWQRSSEAGYQRVEWDAEGYASGVYLYRLSAGDYVASRKMIILK